jgi:hypothetical protein
MTPTVTPAVGSAIVRSVVCSSEILTVLEVSSHRHSGKQKLGTAILRGPVPISISMQVSSPNSRNSSNLAHQVKPAVNPAEHRHPFRWGQPGYRIVPNSDVNGQRSENALGEATHSPPQVGFALTISATDAAMHMQPMPEISQAQTVELAPPAVSAKPYVVVMHANRPLMLTAKEKVAR